MKQRDFFRLFAEKMQGAHAPPDFSGDDWSALQSRLDADDNRRNRALPIGWLAGLAGLLLLSNLGWFFLWQKTGDEVAALRAERLAPMVADSASVRRDTIFQKIVTYQYDTIYRTVVVDRVKQRDLAPSVAALYLPGDASPSKPTSLTSPGTDAKHPDGSQEGWHGEASEAGRLSPGALTEKDLAQTTPDHLKNLAIQPFPAMMHLPIMPPTDDHMIPAKQGPTALLLRPRSFTLGIGGGGMFPVSKVLANSSGLMATVFGEIGFSKQLAMTVEGGYGALRFKGYVEDPSLGLPSLHSPGDDFELKYFETEDDPKPILQLGIGMRWYFHPDGRLNPWLGAGWASQWNPAYELEVEFTNLLTGMEYSEEIVVPAVQKPLSYAGFNFGFRYHLADRWQLHLGGYHDFKTSKQLGIARWWGLQLGVARKF